MNHPLHKMADSNIVFHAANHFLGRAEFDDLISEGMMGLMHAREHHDPARGPFGKFAYQCVVHRMSAWVRANRAPVSGIARLERVTVEDRKRLGYAAVRCAPVAWEHEVCGDLTLAETTDGMFETPEELASRAEDVARVRDAMRVLDARELRVVTQLHSDAEPTQVAVGREMGIGKARVQQLADRAMNKLALQLVRKDAA